MQLILGLGILFYLFLNINGSRQHFLSSTDPHDGCYLIADKQIVTYDEAIRCYKEFPFNETVRENTLDTLKKALPFYAFLDIAKSSPEPKIPLKLDLIEEIRKIGYKSYQYEMNFQNDLVNLFHQLNDGHTGYSSGCFSSFIFRQPFPIVTVSEDFGGQKFLILPEFTLGYGLEETWNKMGFDIKRYAGSEIILIDGIPPLDYFIRYANTMIGASKDINSRINLALARVMQRGGKWGIANGGFTATVSIPNKSAITYTIKLKKGGSETVTIPYLASSPMDFKDSKEFYKKYCAYKEFRIKSPQPGFDPKLPQFKVMQVPKVVYEKLDHPLTSAIKTLDEDPLKNPLTSGEVIQTWMVNNSTGVMTIVSFVASSEQAFLKEAANGFRALKRKGAEKLILDVSNNGGGVICWGYYILDYLFPHSDKRYFDTDMRASKLMLMMADRDNRDGGFFNFNYWLKPDGRPFSNSEDFVGNNRYFRGGASAHYTSLFDDQCGPNPLHLMMNKEYNHKSDSLLPPFPLNKLAVVTNSICYSTCSLLVNGLQEMHGVTTYAMGGVRGQVATTCSIQGGTVYNFEYLLDDLAELGLRNHPDAPKQFPVEASLSLTIREAYSTRNFSRQDGEKYGNRPLEFTWTRASYHKPYPGPATILSPFEQWRQIADDFFHHQKN